MVREPVQLRHRQNPGTRQLAKTSSLTRWDREKATALERGCNGYGFISFLGGALDHGSLAACASCFFVYAYLSVCFAYCSTVSGDHFPASWKTMRGDADQVADVRNRRASVFLPIMSSKIITTVSGSIHRMPWE